jgi:hypothetical protein
MVVDLRGHPPFLGTMKAAVALLLLGVSTTASALIVPRQTAAAAGPSYPTHNLSVPISHFPDSPRYTPHVDSTFPLRYWFDAQYYKSGGPVIVFDGGETDASTRLAYLQKGIIHILAKATNGIGLARHDFRARHLLLTIYPDSFAVGNIASVILEHRYYGESQPFNNLSTDSLRFLSVEQSMADIAHFVQKVEFPGLPDLTAPKTRYILYGGSYSGGLVAFTHKECTCIRCLLWKHVGLTVGTGRPRSHLWVDCEFGSRKGHNQFLGIL